MMNIQLKAGHLQHIKDHGEQTYPEECCGLLLGKKEGDRQIVLRVISTQNSWERDRDLFDNPETITAKNLKPRSTKNAFSINPQTLMKVQKEERKSQLEIIGIYHSHPDCPAIPSEFDLAIAWQEYSYIIVSIEGGKAKDLFSWSLNDRHKFEEQTIIIESDYDKKDNIAILFK